ncbi:hypothetical protein NW765_000056 [Fusarium oxysporum]|nr:hypothetical protein NW765_000056 [Fusarium oxysporum]
MNSKARGHDACDHLVVQNDAFADSGRQEEPWAGSHDGSVGISMPTNLLGLKSKSMYSCRNEDVRTVRRQG